MPEKVILLLDGKRFQFWEDVKITLSLDSIDTFSFTTPFQKNNPAFRENFQPATYKSVQLFLNDEQLLNGQLISRNTDLAGKKLSLGGYSKPGILNDLPVPADKFPLEFKDQDLRSIAAKLLGFYRLSLQFQGTAGPAFTPAVAMEPGQKILEFLISLANNRKLLISNTIEGKLNFFVPGISQVITPLKQGAVPLKNFSVSYDEQKFYSSVTGFGAGDFGRAPESFTVEIPAFKDINRPFIYTVSEAQGAELKSAVELKAGRLLAEAFKITADVHGWRGKNKKVWFPGDFVTIEAPGTFFYRETKLMIRTVNLSQTATEDSVSLELVFPGIYSGQLPEKLPWQ